MEREAVGRRPRTRRSTASRCTRTAELRHLQRRMADTAFRCAESFPSPRRRGPTVHSRRAALTLANLAFMLQSLTICSRSDLLSVENLLDKDYQEVSAFGPRPLPPSPA